MRSVVALLAFVCFCEARPSFDAIVRPSLTFDSYIIGGTEAEVGEFPWQLSQQRQGSTGTWSHSCGASLLSARYALSASHCVDGVAVSAIRVIAGLHDRTVIENGVLSNLLSYKMHESYNTGTGSYPNDIAILTLATEIPANGGNIQYASLPDNNNELLAGQTCVVSGWGRTSATNDLPQYLQKANIGVISTEQCLSYMSSVSGATPTDNNVCVYDTTNESGSCNGDSGGPLNCNYPTANDDRRVVFGVASWVVSSVLGRCLPSYPSVYTRVGSYLAWIATNTP